MNSVIASLRRAREQRSMSLQDVADITLINVKYLRALEAGDFSILPEAYVRAFLRGYASAIGLDPAVIMREFDQAPAPIAAAAAPQHAGPAAAPSQPIPPPPPAPIEAPVSRRPLLIGLGIIGAAVVLIGLWAIRKSDEPAPVSERPFRDVVKEQEMRIAPSGSPAAPVRTAPGDSLTLVGTVTDTCWISISADSLPSHEYTFRPGNRASWKARSFFTVTMGNAGGIAFTLNGTKLEPLGKRGAVVRNARLSPQPSQGR
jgi:hypothetical protein